MGSSTLSNVRLTGLLRERDFFFFSVGSVRYHGEILPRRPAGRRGLVNGGHGGRGEVVKGRVQGDVGGRRAAVGRHVAGRAGERGGGRAGALQFRKERGRGLLEKVVCF